MSKFDRQRPNGGSAPENRSWVAVLLGAVPFLIWGGFMIIDEIPMEWIPYPRLEPLRSVVFWLMVFVPPLGFGLGWVKRFPRWSYPYASLACLFSLYLMPTSTPGLHLFGFETFGRQPWGPLACVPTLLMLLAGWLITRSWQPAGRFFTNLWSDLTLITFAMFGFMPLLTFISFDEVDRAYSLPFMVGLTAGMLATVAAYLRSVSPRQRVVSLTIGIVLIIAVNAAAPAAFFGRDGSANLITPAIAGLIVSAVLLAPAFAELWRHSARISPAT